jgi:hypothetical protein
MALIGLTEAAKLTGKNKATIHRAMKDNRISFTISESGERQIDPAELDRVFPIKPQVAAKGVAESNRTKVASNYVQLSQLSAQLEAEKVRTASLEARIADKDTVIDDLRHRLDREGEERRQAQAQLTALLSDQRPKSPQPRRSWWHWGKSE